MLKLTKKADYGLMAAKHLATVRPRSASTKEIADTYGIPVPVLSKVLQKLARSGYLTSEHGTNGGYRLAGDPHGISTLDVIRAIDGPVFLTHCFTGEAAECELLSKCNVRDPLRKVHEGILKLLSDMSLADLAGGGDRQPLRPQENAAHLTILNS